MTYKPPPVRKLPRKPSPLRPEPHAGKTLFIPDADGHPVFVVIVRRAKNRGQARPNPRYLVAPVMNDGTFGSILPYPVDIEYWPLEMAVPFGFSERPPVHE